MNFLFVLVEIASNGLQRVTRGDKCTFRWTVDEPITSYVIYNRTTGYLTTLHHYGYQDYDNSSGVITLVLNNVQLTDAGNYSLEIVKGSNTVIDSTASLFVYGMLSRLYINVNLSGAELRCPAPRTKHTGDAPQLENHKKQKRRRSANFVAPSFFILHSTS